MLDTFFSFLIGAVIVGVILAIVIIEPMFILYVLGGFFLIGLSIKIGSEIRDMFR